jgi:hypothetical protein
MKTGREPIFPGLGGGKTASRVDFSAQIRHQNAATLLQSIEA